MISHIRSDWLMECGPCKCKWNSGKKTADCKNTTITRVPDGLSTELQVLDLSSNFIPEIYHNEFTQANLHNLHKLFVRNCTLQRLNRNSLKGLEILIELDLSFNLLKSLPRSVFNNLIKIRALILNNNKIERLDDGLFRNLTFLNKIELKENLIVKIESKAFTLLPVLTQIYLDGNQLTILKRECFQHLEKLTGLSLKQNPWNCTCELKPFRDFAFEQNLYTPPTDCYYPESLRGTLWSDVSLDAFACRPKIIYPADQASVSSTNDNVTITCRIQASPNTLIAWTYNKHALSNHPKRIYIKNVSESNGNESITSELTIVNVRQSDEGIYTCTAENVGGKDEIDIQLYVGRNINGNFLLTNQLMFVLCLMAVGLLIISIVIMIVTCCYCRKFKNITKHDLDGDGVGSSGMGMDNGVTNDTKKHFQTIKLNSFNNSTLIGNGSIVTGCSVSGLDRSNKMNGGITITNDCEKQQYASTEFIHANVKADMIVADTHENKSIELTAGKFLFRLFQFYPFIQYNSLIYAYIIMEFDRQIFPFD